MNFHTNQYTCYRKVKVIADSFLFDDINGALEG
jgi:hypothetical protein